jgi:hypothetical protein
MSDIRFLIVGAPKAGTTSLFEYMRHHPEVHMPANKEVFFFNMDSTYRRGWEWYRATLLRGAPPGAACGEATTEYMRGAPWRSGLDDDERTFMEDPANSAESLEEVIPRRIKLFLPDVKLMCVLRDPVTRAYSHHLMRKMERADSRTFDEAIDQLMTPAEMERARAEPSRINGYVACGEYSRLLAGFLRVFPREQLMVIFSDELAQRPAETLAQVFAFIGVSVDFVPENLDTRHRAGAARQRIPGVNLVTWRHGVARLRWARALWFALPYRVRLAIYRLYGVASYRIELWNARRGEVDEGISPSARRKLIAHFRPDSDALAGMLGRDIPWLASWERSG